MFAVIYAVADNGTWHARAADLPVSTCGGSREDAERLIREAIASQLEEDLREGKAPPPPMARDAGMVDVEVPHIVAR